MPQLFFRCCYNIFIYLIMLPALGYFLLRSRKDPAYRQRMAERFSLQQVPAAAMGGIVVHAVSMGEVVAATPLIKALQQQYPQLTLTVTCTTPTGSARIVSTFAESVYHCYLPLDTPGAVRRFLHKLQPQAVVVLETELWPNLLQQCRRALIPTIVVNARLSARSARGYHRFYAFSRLALDNISLLLAQDSATARRFKALGCKAQLSVAGNLKYDMTVPAHTDSLVAQFRPQLTGRKVWVAGSTHAGEDEQLISAYQQLSVEFPDLLLILVPRHPERFAAVAQLLQDAGLSTVRRSGQREVTADCRVLLGDSMGELLAWYQLADVVFIGGSLIARGGHNPLEAMCFAKPLQTGPHVFNFAQAYQWLQQADAVNWVSDTASLVSNTAMLLRLPQQAAEQGAAALALYQRHGGACARISKVISDYLGFYSGNFRVHRMGNAVQWYDAQVFCQPEQLSFTAAHWQQQQAVIGQSRGRNIAWFIRHNGTELVMRHYYRGGLIGKLIKDNFSYQSVLASRAMQEFNLLRYMQRCGLPVPRPLAAQYVRNGLFYRADIMIALIKDSRDLATILAAGTALSPAQWHQVGVVIARFHQQGVYHSDLNCHNILLDSSGQVWLIDFDKCTIRQHGDWMQQNLARLQRSLQKELGLHANFSWQQHDWQALLQGYKQQLNG